MNYLRYAGIVFALTVGVPFVLGLLRQLTGVNLSTAFVAILPAIAGASIEGQKYATRHMRVPTAAETRSFVVVATLIAAGFQLALTVAVLTSVAGFPRLLLSPAMIGVMVFLAAVIAFSNMLFLRMGAKNQLKRQNNLDVFK